MKKLTNKFLIGFLFGFLMIVGFNNAEAAVPNIYYHFSDEGTSKVVLPNTSDVFEWDAPSLDHNTYYPGEDIKITYALYMKNTPTVSTPHDSSDNLLVNTLISSKSSTTPVPQTSYSVVGSYKNDTTSVSSGDFSLAPSTNFYLNDAGYSFYAGSSSHGNDQYLSGVSSSNPNQSTSSPNSFDLLTSTFSAPTQVGTYTLSFKPKVSYHIRAQKETDGTWELVEHDIPNISATDPSSDILSQTEEEIFTITFTVANAPYASTFSTTNCEITYGHNSCDTIVKWDIKNPNTDPESYTNILTYHYPTPLEGETVSVAINSDSKQTTNLTGVSHNIKYGSSETFYLYHNGQGLDSSTPIAECASGLGWRLSANGTLGCFYPKVSFTATKISDNTDLPISTDGLSRTSPAVSSQTPVKIKYTPSGLNFPFTCVEPVSLDHPNPNHSNPSGYEKTFTSQFDVENYAFFNITPNSTTKYDVTCTDGN